MSNTVTIRAYEPNDKAEVIKLIQLNTPMYFAPHEEHDFSTYLEEQRELYYVLLYADRIVGCGGINFAQNKTVGKLSWGMFHPDFQRKTLGTQLLNYRLEKLKAIDGIEEITVRTSQQAYRFFEKRGFSVFEIKKDYWAKGLDLYSMKYKFF